MKNNNIKICIAGDGWGAIAVLKGIINNYPIYEICTNDNELIRLSNKSIVIKELSDSKSDIIICSGHKKIISEDLINTKRIINIHPSLLPKYRGLHAVVWALLNNESEIGITIHEVNKYIDDGPIIKQFIWSNDNISTSYQILTYLLNQIEINIFDVITKYINGDIKLLEQDKQKATYVGKRNIEDCKIPFERDFTYLKNFFRAIVSPYPLPFIRILKSKEVFYIKKVKYHVAKLDTDIGRILNVDNEGVWIKTKDGYLILQEIENEKLERIDYNYFKIGQKLEK